MTGDTELTHSRESALLRGLAWSMRRRATVRTPYDLAVAMGLLHELHAKPSAAQQDAAVSVVVRYVLECVPDLEPLAVEAAVFAEFELVSSVVEKVRRAV